MADVELLPLPLTLRHPSDKDLADHVQTYASANLAPLQAENERLRAEVERLNRIIGRIVEGDGDSTLTIRADADAFAAAREYLSAHKPESADVRDGEHDALVNRRAERLAEALRRYGQHDDTCGVLVFGQILCTCGFSAAIQDQEDRNG